MNDQVHDKGWICVNEGCDSQDPTNSFDDQCYNCHTEERRVQQEWSYHELNQL